MIATPARSRAETPNERAAAVRLPQYLGSGVKHGRVRAAGRHGPVRRVEDRIANRGRDLLDLLVHPEGRPGDRRGRHVLHDRPGRVRLGAAIVAMSAYPLTEARFQEIVREVAQRRAAQQEVVL